MRLVDSEGLVALSRTLAQLDVASELGIDPAGGEADLIIRMAQISTADVRGQLETLQTLDDAGIDDIAAASEQLTLLRRLFDEEVLLNSDSARSALEEELPAALTSNLVIRRPGNRLLLDRAPQGQSGLILEDSALTPDDPSDDRPEVAWLRLGERALMLIIPNLESMLVRSVPFVIAGLAVALGFKAGLFNIGAEGQLYAGAIIAVVLGFMPPFTELPGPLHLLLVLGRRHAGRLSLGRDSRRVARLDGRARSHHDHHAQLRRHSRRGLADQDARPAARPRGQRAAHALHRRLGAATGLQPD